MEYLNNYIFFLPLNTHLSVLHSIITFESLNLIFLLTCKNIFKYGIK